MIITASEWAQRRRTAFDRIQKWVKSSKRNIAVIALLPRMITIQGKIMLDKIDCAKLAHDIDGAKQIFEILKSEKSIDSTTSQETESLLDELNDLRSVTVTPDLSFPCTTPVQAFAPIYEQLIAQHILNALPRNPTADLTIDMAEDQDEDPDLKRCCDPLKYLRNFFSM